MLRAIARGSPSTSGAVYELYALSTWSAPFMPHLFARREARELHFQAHRHGNPGVCHSQCAAARHEPNDTRSCRHRPYGLPGWAAGTRSFRWARCVGGEASDLLPRRKGWRARCVPSPRLFRVCFACHAGRGPEPTGRPRNLDSPLANGVVRCPSPPTLAPRGGPRRTRTVFGRPRRPLRDPPRASARGRSSPRPILPSDGFWGG